MARKKTSKVRVNVKASISRRLREVRQELFGEHGGPELARRLNLPARTWYNYETGVTVPAEVLLAFIDQTGANPVWLLSGEGERFRREAESAVLSDLTPIQLIRRGLEKLEQQPSEVVVVSPGEPAGRRRRPTSSRSRWSRWPSWRRADRPRPGRGPHPGLSGVAAAPAGDRRASASTTTRCSRSCRPARWSPSTAR